jgi:hypothetical protein
MHYNSSGNWKYSLLILFFLLQKPYGSVIQSNVTSQTLTVGDRVSFQVAVIVPKGATITPPSIDNGLGNIIVKEWNTFKAERDSSDSVTFSYLITTYIPERCTIPSLTYIINDGKKNDTLLSQVIPLDVKSVITSDTVDIKDLKAQHQAGHVPLWWIWITALILLVTTGIILYKYFFAKKSKPAVPIPLLPPYEEAIAAINELESKKHLIRGLVREYVFELSEILKRYIERRFSINASEFTTEEMIAWLGISGLDTKAKQSVDWFFRTSDPVKFARHIPEEIITNRFMKETMEFLGATRPLLQDSGETSKSQASLSKSPEVITSKNEMSVTGEKNEI